MILQSRDYSGREVDHREVPYREIQSYLPLPNPNYVTLLTINSEKKQEVNALLTDFVFPSATSRTRVAR